MLSLLNFTQVSNSKFAFRFNRKIRDGYVLFKDKVPAHLLLETMQNEVQERVEIIANRFTVEVEIPESVDSQIGEYSVVLVVRSKGGVLDFFSSRPSSENASDPGFCYLELIRQPSVWLYSTFKFSRPKGYTILGRRTIDVGSTVGPLSPPTLEFHSVPDVSAIADMANDPILAEIALSPELLIASKIIRMLWSGEMRDSPTEQSYSTFVQQPFEVKLAQIRMGLFPVSCQGMRDMFLHAALGFSGLNVRAVNAHNYSPQFQDLIAYAHATAEIFVSGLDKWILSDPWTGFALKNARGEYMGAADLVGCHGDFVAVPLIAEITQSHLGVSGVISKVSRAPAKTLLDSYTFTPGGHIPSYGIYFRQIEYITPHLSLLDSNAAT